MDLFSDPALNPAVILATIIYAVIGVVIMLICVVLFDKIFDLDLHKELVEDQNTAFGILLGGVSIALAIVIGSSIVG